MASKGSNTSLQPSFGKDSFGLYVSVSCGKVSGKLYPDKMSKKSPGKCVWVDNQWYTPTEVEVLGGKKAARKWKQSLLHLGRRLAEYDLSCGSLSQPCYTV